MPVDDVNRIEVDKSLDQNKVPAEERQILSIQDETLNHVRWILQKRDPYEQAYFGRDYQGLKKIVNEELQDEELKKKYESIVINGDREVLKMHSKERSMLIRQRYNAVVGDDERLQRFRTWIQESKPIRNDERKDVNTFESPARSKNINSFEPADVFLRSDQYVYGSLNYLPHFMTVKNLDNITELDEYDIKDRAEFVMMDGFFLRNQPRFIKTYLNNLFAFGEGKEILATYLAFVFSDVREAEAFIDAALKLAMAQRWSSLRKSSPEEIAHVIMGENIENIQKRAVGIGFGQFWKTDAAEIVAFFTKIKGTLLAAGIDERKLADIFNNMQILDQELGFIPPMNSEVRVKDYAKVKRVA